MECFNDGKYFPSSAHSSRSKSWDFYFWKYSKRDLELKRREVVEREITRSLALRRSFVSFYFSSSLINITIFFHAFHIKLRRNFSIRRINVTEALFAKPACLLFVKTTESHDVTRVTSQASRRRPPGAELFIDAPSNKLFSGQGASRGTATTGSFCLINARTISTRQSVVAWLLPHGVALFGSLVSVATTLSRSLRRLSVEKYRAKIKGFPRRMR